MRGLLADDATIVVWRLAGTELVSALWRRARAGEVSEGSRLAAERALGDLERGWTSVEDLAHTDRRARRLLALHPLRAADALHLAAALVACDERPQLLPFVTLDGRLGDAARREGFTVLG
jgi:predicted nucleic acid-binding protein